MRIVLVGAVSFTQRCLEALVEAGANVVAVLTLAPEDGGFHGDYVDLGPAAERHGIPVVRVRDLGDPAELERLRSLAPDLVCVFGWSRLLPTAVLEIPRLGCIGSHPALLPEHRGRHPITWALVEGLTESGLTFFYLDEAVDSGDILWQRPFPIALEHDAASVYRKIEDLAKTAIREFLPRLADGTAPREPQDHSRATYWRRRTDEDRRIDWADPSMTNYNLVRGLARPYVGATTLVGGAEAIVWRAALPDGALPPGAAGLAPGTVVRRDRETTDVRCGDSYLTILEVEPPLPAWVQEGVRLGGDG